MSHELSMMHRGTDGLCGILQNEEKKGVLLKLVVSFPNMNTIAHIKLPSTGVTYGEYIEMIKEDAKNAAYICMKDLAE